MSMVCLSYNELPICEILILDETIMQIQLFILHRRMIDFI